MSTDWVKSMSDQEANELGCGAGLGAAAASFGVDALQTELPFVAASSKEDRYVYLVSQEGEKFKVSVKAISISELVKQMISEDGSAETDVEDCADEIPLPNVKCGILLLITDFLRHYVSEPMRELEKPLTSNVMADVVQPYYAEFVDKLSMDTLYELVLAANYMDIQPLLELTCAKIATLIKGKSPEEIRRTFNIHNDFTPEEEAATMEENSWCEDL